MDPVEQVPGIGQTHDAAVAMIADTVAELTRRAVEPTLMPFRRNLQDSIDRWEGNLEAIQAIAETLTARQQDIQATHQDFQRELQTAHQHIQATQQELQATQRELQAIQQDLRTGQHYLYSAQQELTARVDATTSVLSQLSATAREHADLLAASRAHDTTVADQLQELQALSADQHKRLAQLDSERTELTATFRSMLDAERAQLAPAVRAARLVFIIGFAILFAEILGCCLVLLLHVR